MLDDDELAEVLATNRWYSLTADEDGFAIWDVAGSSDDPVSEFARTDEGSEEAWAEFRRLTRDARLHRRVPRLLLGATVVGTAVWLVTGAIEAAIFATALSSNGDIGFTDFLSWVQIADTVAFRVALGSVTILVAWFMVESLGRFSTSRRSTRAVASRDRELPRTARLKEERS